MQNKEILSKVESLASEVAEREGLKLYDLELIGAGNHRTLRVYIDKTVPLEPVSVNDCAQFSRAFNLVLDVEDVIPGGAYQLEVSSPGLERQLTKPWHFEGAVGKKIWVKSKRPFAEHGYQNPAFQKSYQLNFMLTKTSPLGISLSDDSGEFELPWEFLEKANLVFEFGNTEKTVGKNFADKKKNVNKNNWKKKT